MALTAATRRRRGRQGIGFMGLLGLGDKPPQRVPGVRHHAVYARPEWCAKCGGVNVSDDSRDPRRSFCFDCGSDFFLVSRA